MDDSERVMGRGHPRGAAGTKKQRIREMGGLWVRFALVGLLKTVVDFATFNLVLVVLPGISLPVVLLANTAGFTVAVSVSFILNARFTFRAAPRAHGFSRYIVISLIGLALYNGSLAAVLAVWNPEDTLGLNVAKVGALGASMVWNFLGYRFLVFGPGRARS
jgi:putative flippase GtrA